MPTLPIAPWPAGQTPYVTPDLLTQFPTAGVQWTTIPPKTGANNPTDQQRFAVQASVCMSATQWVDQYLNQPIRCTQTEEEFSGPNYRVTVQQSSGNGRIIASRWPVIHVASVSVSDNRAWPRQFTALPSGTFEPEYPVDGLFGASVPSSGGGGQGILFAPGYVTWPGGWPGGQFTGRNLWRVSFTYLSGWPHTSLTSSGTVGATSIAVDDCTGWYISATSGANVGANGVIYDALGGGQEPIVATGTSVTSGPGTISLASALVYNHDPGIVVSAMPQTVMEATALKGAHLGLTRGVMATTVQTTGGRQQAGRAMHETACMLLSTFRRTI